MNSEYTVVPIQGLTWKVIDKLQIHSTVDSLRRSGSVSPCIEFVQGTDQIPNLYYIKDQVTDSEWSIHALTSDILKFLLGNSLQGELISNLDEDTFKECEQIITEPKDTIDTSEGPKSLLIRDSGLLGKSIIEVRSGANLTFSGELASTSLDLDRDITEEGYWLGVQLLSDNITKYPSAVIRYSGENYCITDLKLKYSNLGSGVFLFFKVTQPGQIFPIQIDWSEGQIEYLTVAVTQEIKFK